MVDKSVNDFRLKTPFIFLTPLDEKNTILDLHFDSLTWANVDACNEIR